MASCNCNPYNVNFGTTTAWLLGKKLFLLGEKLVLLCTRHLCPTFRSGAAGCEFVQKNELIPVVNIATVKHSSIIS